MWHRCMNGVETEEEFESLWNEMIDPHVPPEKSKWLRDMYLLRRRWASVFSQSIFTTGMHTTTRSQGTNRVLKAFSRSSNSLLILLHLTRRCNCVGMPLKLLRILQIFGCLVNLSVKILCSFKLLLCTLVPVIESLSTN